MELKTKISAEDGRRDLTITRDFELPVELLFRAYAEREFIEQWMGTTVTKLESKPFGYFEFETYDREGNTVFSANGSIHEFETNLKITRTFKMLDTQFDVQLEFLEFEKLTEETSRLKIHTIYKSGKLRDEMLKLPFAAGLNMAHNRLESIAAKFK